MAPKRRLQTAQRTPSGQQSKLTFHGRQSRVTKPSIAQQAKSTKKDASLIEDVVHSDVEVDDEHEVPEPERATRQQAEEDAAPDPLQSNKDAVKAEEVLGGRAHQSESGAVGGKGSGWVADEEEQARKITDTQIKKYWRDKEQERLAPRVHQEDLGVYEKVLREWDMSGQYGPCIGIARLKRWKRANLLGLNPPLEVLAVLLKKVEAGDTKTQRAHVDELMSSRFVET